MNETSDHAPVTLRMSLWLGLLVAGWTAVVLGLTTATVVHERRETDALARLMARNEARVAFDAALLFHEWAAAQGGIWVAGGDPNGPPAATEPPVVVDGDELDYQSPAAMSREALKLSLKGSLIRGQLVSSEPDPSSSSPPWKNQALSAFAAGSHEYVTLDRSSGQAELVLARPLMASYSCLGCHPGRHEGDVLGAIAFTVPMGLARASAGERPVSSIATFHLVLWIAGTLGIALWGGAVKRRLATV